MSRFRQHLAAVTANLATVSGGTAYGWTSPALPLLQDVSDEDGSWIGALLPLGALFGALPAGFMAAKMGLKRAILSLTVPYILGWLCIIFAQRHLEVMFAGRFITGLALGATTVLVSRYCEEIAEDSIRGALGVYLDFSLTLGYLVVNTLGIFLPYMWLTVASSVMPFLFFATFFWMPESPVYLGVQDRWDEAAQSLAWLRKSDDVQAELKHLQESLTVQTGEGDNQTFIAVIKDVVKNGSFSTLKTVAIVYILVFFQQTLGIDTVIFYSVQIFHSTGVGLSGNISSVILCVCQAVSDFVSLVLVDRIGRRPMLLASAASTAVAQAALSVFFHFKELHYDMSHWHWVPISALVVFVTGYTLGFSCLPWLIMNELVPARMKGWVNSGVVCMNWGLVFLVSKEFPTMEHHLGKDVTYGIFCVMCVCSFVFVFLFLPETKGKSRDEIQEVLRSKKG